MALIDTTTTNGVSTLVMDDGKANVLSFAMFAELAAALDRAEAEADVVVLAGRPGKFSGGFDLATLTAFTPESADLLRTGFETSRRLLSFPMPVVVACTGHAYAMGAFLLLSGDVRLGIAGANHRITANEVAIGMTLPRAAIEVCRQRLTPAHFERATALAEVFDPETAVAAGWLDDLVEEDDLPDAAQRRAASLTGLDRKAHVETKLRTRAQMLRSLDAAIAEDDDEFRRALAEAASDRPAT